MSRLFSTAVSAMTAHAQGIEVHGNNVANVNTTGYRAARPQFETLFSQTLRIARGGVGTMGGVDPMEVGGGVAMGNTATLHGQGSVQFTGQNLDLSILGRGFFMLKAPDGGEAFTRDGALGLDASGRLTHASSGFAVQGLLVDPTTNTIPSGAVPEDITIPPGLTLNARATTTVDVAGNLDARAAVGDTNQMQYRYYDSLGVAHVMTVDFKKTAANAWTWTSYVDAPANQTGTGALTFNSVGDVQNITSSTISIPAGSPGLTTGATAPQAIEIGLDTLTQYAAAGEVQATNQDGFPPGSLTDVTVDDLGNVQAVFSNGQSRALAKLALVDFANLNGLQRSANNLFLQTANSGSPQVVGAGNAGVGKIQSQALERSNVDLANELTSLIVLQRGYQASTRLVSTADEMMQEALNLKR
jgi:flagellar hook protein FlgE